MLFGMGNDEPAGGRSKGVKAQFVKDTWAQKEREFWWEQSANHEGLKKCAKFEFAR
jgi:hypothetical protein